MRILVNHLTRMQPGYICVAGIDLATNNHVRPVLAGRLGTGLLRRNGGPFDVGSVVDLGRTKHTGHAPEMEDYRFDPRQAFRSHTCDSSDYWQILESVSRPTLTDIFGNILKQRERSCTVDAGIGKASLGCLKLSTLPTLYINNFDRVRIYIDDGRYTADLSVTDLRLCEADHQTPRRTLVRKIARRISEGEGVILSVGLTRPWKKEGDTAPRHWLQVNNIHLENDPIWNESLG